MANELVIAAPNGTTNYAIIRDSLNHVWSVTNNQFETWSNANLDDYVIDLTSRGGGLYTADFPTNIANGTYTVTYYWQSGGSETVNDAILNEVQINWTGSTQVYNNPFLGQTALASLEDVKTLLNINQSDISKDNLLALLINQATAEIQKYCNRSFLAQDYVETVWVNYQEMVILRNSPLIEITKIGFNRDDVMSVTNTTALRATCLVTDNELKLNTTDQYGNKTTSTFPWSVYKTTAALVAGINNISGYTAVLYNNVPTDELWPSNGVNVNTTQYLGAIDPNEELLDYDINTKIGAISFNVLPTRMVRVWYRGGYETIPNDLSGLACEFVRILYHQVGMNPLISSDIDARVDRSVIQREFAGVRDKYKDLFNKYRFIPCGDTIPQNVIQSTIITSDTMY